MGSGSMSLESLQDVRTHAVDVDAELTLGFLLLLVSHTAHSTPRTHIPNACAQLFLLYANEGRKDKVVLGLTDTMYKKRLSTIGNIDSLGKIGFMRMMEQAPGLLDRLTIDIAYVFMQNLGAWCRRTRCCCCCCCALGALPRTTLAHTLSLSLSLSAPLCRHSSAQATRTQRSPNTS
jgi:hypothetical protein